MFRLLFLARGSAILERNNPGHSHHQMTFRPSDSTTAKIPAIRESSTEVSREKGPSYTGVRKLSKATESPLAMARRALAHAQDAFTTTRTAVYAMATEQICKNSRRADPRHEESTEPDGPDCDWKRVPRVKLGKNLARLEANRYVLHRQNERSSNGALSTRGSERMPIGR